jgi:hypothetical protein
LLKATIAYTRQISFLVELHIVIFLLSFLNGKYVLSLFFYFVSRV